MKLDKYISIIIPVYNGETTLDVVFKSLEKQNNKNYIKEIIFINDNSNDNSENLIIEYQKISSYKSILISHNTSFGLAKNYNEGINIAKTDLILLMHQDIFLIDNNSFDKISKPFFLEKNIVITHPILLHPYDIWIKYNFWQKVLFSRYVDKKNPKFTGKFDCIKKLPGLRFDEKSYRTAGEDYDYEIKSSKYGNMFDTNLEIIHIHNNDNNFGFKSLFKKEVQLAEAYGVNFRRYFFKTSIKNNFLLLIRPFLLFSIFIPYLQINKIGILIMLFYLFFYTKLVYIKCFYDKKILLLPIINFINLAGYSIFFIKGFFTLKQKI